ncbi:hypothetical protein SALBM217S_00002 [Streptomyces griseoloalbus]
MGSRQGRPDGSGRAALGQGTEEGGALPVPLPGARLGGRGRWQGLRGGLGLGAAVAGRDGELEDVGEAARVPVGHRAGEGEQLGPEDRLRGDHIGEGGQRALVVGLGAALDDEPVDQATPLAPPALDVVAPGAEPHPHPHARLGVGVQLLGDRVVEVLVEVEDPLVDQHPGHGQLLGQRGAAPGARLARGTLARRTVSRISASCSGAPAPGSGAPAPGSADCSFSLLTAKFLPDGD